MLVKSKKEKPITGVHVDEAGSSHSVMVLTREPRSPPWLTKQQRPVLSISAAASRARIRFYAMVVITVSKRPILTQCPADTIQGISGYIYLQASLCVESY
jgi:hypothetical protein